MMRWEMLCRCILHLVGRLHILHADESQLEHYGTRIIPMSRVAVMMSENHVKAQMSSHFGKAEWVMASDTESHTFVFLKNEAANGKSVAELVASQGCTDAIFNGIGNGALAHLKATNVRGWVAPPNISGQQALERFEQLQ